MKNKGLIIGLAGAGVLLLFIIGSYISFYNTAVKLENATRAQYQQNQNNYDAFWKKISEMAQVPDKYKDDFKEVLVGNMEARYGKGGSKAQWQWIQEHAVNLDPKVYEKLMTAIEAGRNDFEQNQKMLLDKQRRYHDHVESFGGSIWAGFSGHPKEVMGELAPTKDLDGDGKLTVLDYPIVTSGKTKQAFAEGEDDALDVFGEGK